jgi:hypothetical protein
VGGTQLDGDGDVPADALSDLRTEDNALSVWSVESDHRNLNVALAALASGRDRLDKLDYTLLDEATLQAIPITCIRSDGKTPHSSANKSIHRDLTELTVQKIGRLSLEMMPLRRMRVPQKEIKRLLQESLKTGALDRNLIGPKLLIELESISV